jgi:hypothetical protein
LASPESGWITALTSWTAEEWITSAMVKEMLVCKISVGDAGEVSCGSKAGCRQSICHTLAFPGLEAEITHLGMVCTRLGVALHSWIAAAFP